MYSKLSHLSSIYCSRHLSYITLLPSLSSTRTFLFSYSNCPMKYFSHYIWTIYWYVVDFLTNCGLLEGPLNGCGAWTHGKRRCSKMTHEYSVQPGKSMVGFYVRRKDIPLDCRIGYTLLCVSAFLIRKIISIGKAELIRNHYVTYKAGLEAKDSPWQ